MGGGANRSGQLGIGTTEREYRPVKIMDKTENRPLSYVSLNRDVRKDWIYGKESDFKYCCFNLSVYNYWRMYDGWE